MELQTGEQGIPTWVKVIWESLHLMEFGSNEQLSRFYYLGPRSQIWIFMCMAILRERESVSLVKL